MPDGFFERYVDHFFAAAKSAPPVEKLVLFDNYHLQKDEPEGRNPLAAKNKNLFEDLKVGARLSVAFIRKRQSAVVCRRGP